MNTWGLRRPEANPAPSPLCANSSLHSDTLGPPSIGGIGFMTCSPLQSALHWTPRATPPSLVIGIDGQLYDPDHFLIESLLVIWHRLACWLIGQRIKLDHATFCYPAPPMWQSIDTCSVPDDL